MRLQLRELFDKGMQGVIFHGRYGLEMPYLGERYLERVRFGVEEANRLGLTAWIYDEMNWPSGTSDKQVLKERPDLAQRYLECVSFSVRGPWFMCLTGEDSRYLDFQRSTPVAVFAIAENGSVIDLTSNLSFKKVVPWEVPPGLWQLCYIVEKRADYYIDALDPESTQTFLRLGYDPYVETLWNGNRSMNGAELVGFYSDEPAMHYFLTARDNPVVPWTKDMFRRFRDRNGYDLRSRLLDLFFDLNPESAATRHDFYTTTTEFYSDAYYRQIHEWCRERDVVFTAHLLYEEWLRQMVRVEGNPFRHYEHMDVVAVDHLYPVIGSRQSPDQHVAIKLASSAAHHFRSDRLICESFGGIFMDATMQRMKWIADWEYVLGVNVLNPHGFHYTLEGHRKRDWPPSMFYQYPWWHYYNGFSGYMTRISEALTGGSHVAKVAVLWPINAMFASYMPSERTPESDMIEAGLNLLTDLLLRLHHDFDYLDEEVLATAEFVDGRLSVADEVYELVIIPPMTHIRVSSVDSLERFVASGGRVLGVLTAPLRGLRPGGLSDVASRMEKLVGKAGDLPTTGYETVHANRARGAGAFLYGDTSVLTSGPDTRRDGFAGALDRAVRSLIDPDVEISNPDVFVLHRRKDESDIYFVVNTTFEPQAAHIRVAGESVALWDPVSGEHLTSETQSAGGTTTVELTLAPVGSLFVVTGHAARPDAEVASDSSKGARASALQWSLSGGIDADETIELGGAWTFEAEDDNALVLKTWRASAGHDDDVPERYASPDADDTAWNEVVAGAWAYQLAAEPERPWPIPVWYRVDFEVDDIPTRLCLLVDGFDGDGAAVWLNGAPVIAKGVRSRLDAQMQELDLRGLVRNGRNVLAIRLLLRDPTGGLVDHIKLVGNFALKGEERSGFRIGGLPGPARARSWTELGHPYFSGRGIYSTSFDLTDDLSGQRILLEVPMNDDVLEVELNGQAAGICLWEPYIVDVTQWARPGVNQLRLKVANTPANLLNGDPRPSGLRKEPRVSMVPGAPSPSSSDTIAQAAASS
jgi:hypothetical protein